MTSTEELKRACEEIITNKLLDAERVKCRLRTSADDLRDWGCNNSICINDEFWDIVERIYKLGKD